MSEDRELDALVSALDHFSHAPHIMVAANVCSRSASALNALRKENAKLRAMLEIDPRHSYDGIDARDKTITMQDAEILRMMEENRVARIDELEAALVESRRDIERLREQLASAIDQSASISEE